jgi:glycosyltransferase involved in cell wall biosynthesis
MQNSNLVSIVIPTYEMSGEGSFFLSHSLKKILEQTYKNIEVIVTDHSKDEEIELVCKNFEQNLNIKYIKNNVDLGSSSSNINNGIKNSKGFIIKILMQDDFLYEKNCIEKIVSVFETEKTCNWLVTGCVFGGKNFIPNGKMYPTYTDDVVLGTNKIGSPSVLTIKNENPLFFDKNLLWMMDCEYYKRLYDSFGKPNVLLENNVYITQHIHQLTNSLENERKNYETKLICKKYKKC